MSQAGLKRFASDGLPIQTGKRWHYAMLTLACPVASIAVGRDAILPLHASERLGRGNVKHAVLDTGEGASLHWHRRRARAWQRLKRMEHEIARSKAL